MVTNKRKIVGTRMVYRKGVTHYDRHQAQGQEMHVHDPSLFIAGLLTHEFFKRLPMKLLL